MDFFPKDYLLVMDESHATVPQIGGMYAGDRSRKTVLVEHGFRLPSAHGQPAAEFPGIPIVAKPNHLSQRHPAATGAELVRRAASSSRSSAPPAWWTRRSPLKPLTGQIDDLMEEIRQRAAKKERTLVTTLTKKSAEELTDYLRDLGINVRYLHSEIDAIERVEVLRALRKGDFDVLVGINLLREGLDLPEVSLVAILDADKEGYLRSATSLIQTAGRAARHINGEVILYADVMTQSIRKFLSVSEYRRERQLAYNKEHNITPRSVSRAVEESLAVYQDTRHKAALLLRETGGNFDLTETLRDLQEEMLAAADNLEFEKAALLRDQIRELKTNFGEGEEKSKAPPRDVNYKKSARGRKQRTKAGQV